MKQKLLIFFVLVLSLSSGCKKDDIDPNNPNNPNVVNGSISGLITYRGAITNITYNAQGAKVYILEGTCSPGNLYDKMTTTNSGGRYNFTSVPPGTYALDAEITVNGFNYYGSTCVTVGNGQSRTINLTLN